MTNPQHGNQTSQSHDHDEHPSDLHEPVNWMTYSHVDLYNMLTKDVDLASAQNVRDGWTSIGTVLHEVQGLLETAIKSSDAGWQGDAAEKAREGLGHVSKWTGDAAHYTTTVSALIDTEIKNVSDAIHAMPPPPQPTPPPVPVPPQPTQVISGYSMMGMNVPGVSAEQMFGPAAAQQILAAQQANQFAGAAQIGASSVDMVTAADSAHRQAADVMAAFQRNSATVDQTVPQLAPPTNPVAPPPGGGQVGTMKHPTGGPADGSGAGAGGPVVTGPAGGPTDTRTSSSRGGGYGYGRMPMTGGGGGGGNFGRTFMPPAAAASGAAGGIGAGGGGLGGAGSAAASESSRSGGIGGAAAAQNVNQTKAFQNPLQMGAAPMAGAPAGAAGRGGEDEREYKHAAYLEEDDNVFGLDRKAAPPVIGQ
ncbi:hypothetical protein Lesp02_46950 [Lentzea sp. NBRC 105346]|uniref:hypothetical protein n=1 Tax=Lentzea sp. NBRC 105346 TaxID=3032205 RepID=UPI0024A042D0|nr:hypothetical protein [Lentzea sp. NBRC 105346]GLZ32507.1 hypothetical protein Lesp02_46950 [Lentzea sp. NBRC 105346]